MYYPYLRGKQFELIALREFADSYNNYAIMPIIEPVKQAFNSMTLAINVMRNRGLKFALILNPQVGDIVGNTQIIETELADALANYTSWSPAFIVSNSNQNQIITHISHQNYNNVILICKENLDSSAVSLSQLVQMNNVTHLVISPEKTQLKRLANRNNKLVIRLDDNFNTQKKNKDYLAVSEEMFTEEHKFYHEDGYVGISDYTVLSSEFVDGGMLPFAIAIHWTYEKTIDSIWVRHFVSDTNDDNTNIQGKFAEAARKAIAFFDSNMINNNAAAELRRYVHEGRFPGLGVIKKLSIKNHIELMNLIFTRLEI
jgi:hypothetical protein